jgi:hypothetical protein
VIVFFTVTELDVVTLVLLVTVSDELLRLTVTVVTVLPSGEIRV